ncbi:MAG TPA: TlpA disulfide reductase family protein [Tepidisphaeraceae bacterium]|jgi:thiol-disulfide isomerase/thioredoxin
MKLFRRHPAAGLLLLAVVTAGVPLSMAQPAAPGAGPSPESMARIQAAQSRLQAAIPSIEALSDPLIREKIAPEAIGAAKQILAEIDQLAAAQPMNKDQWEGARLPYEALLYTFNDAPTKTRLEAEASAGESFSAIWAQSTILQGGWFLAGSNAQQQTKVVDALEKLAGAHPENKTLTGLAFAFSNAGATPELSVRLETLLGTMRNPAAEQIKPMIEARRKLRTLVNQPLIIAGKTPDGRPFSTADWKGKVVLVDFWATWCLPCIVALPDLKETYEAYHDKGLEIIGVSSDYSANDLTQFTAKEKMLWPQIFDPTAAAAQEWHPVAKELGVMAIPTLFLIDKKGIVRSVTAEDYKELIPKLLAE